MVRDMISEMRKDYIFIMKIGIFFLFVVIIGILVPSVFPEDLKNYIADINELLLSGLQGNTELSVVGFLRIFCMYMFFILILWLTGSSRLGMFTALGILIILGLIFGIGINIIFSLGFAYGMLLFLTSMLLGYLLISSAFILVVYHIHKEKKDLLNYSYGFVLPIILIFVACWYLVFAGPLILDFILNLI